MYTYLNDYMDGGQPAPWPARLSLHRLKGIPKTYMGNQKTPGICNQE